MSVGYDEQLDLARVIKESVDDLTLDDLRRLAEVMTEMYDANAGAVENLTRQLPAKR